MSEINKKDIWLKLKIKNEKKNYKYKRPYSFITSYNQIKEMINPNNDENVIIYLNHSTTKQPFIIYNEEDWNLLYNFGLIEKCFTPFKSNEIMLTIEYLIIKEKNSNEEEIKEKKDNFSKIMKHIIETINIPQTYFFDIFFNFLNSHEEYKDIFKKFFLDELIRYKTNTKDENKNKHIYMIESNEFLNSLKKKLSDSCELIDSNKQNDLKSSDSMDSIDSLKQKILESNNTYKKILKIIDDEKKEKINELTNSDLQKIKDNQNNSNEIGDSSSIKEQNDDFEDLIDQNGLFKALNNKQYDNEINEFKNDLTERIKREIMSI
jgi:hypothetical protein